MQVATKRKAAWLWGGAKTRLQVEAEHAAGTLSGDDLVCPVGMAEEAVSVSVYLESPEVFEKLPAVAEAVPIPAGETPQPVEGILVVALTIMAGLIVAMGFAFMATALQAEATFEGSLAFLLSSVAVALLVLAAAAGLRILLRIEAAVSTKPRDDADA